jgi:R3H domain protein
MLEMIVKSKYTGKTKEEAINQAKLSLQETENNLYIRELETKGGLFGKKVEIEVICRDDLITYVKNFLKQLIENMDLTANLEVKKREDTVLFTIYSDHNSILIGKNGRTLDAITTITKQMIQNLVNRPFHFTIDIGEYKKQHEERLIRLAKKIAKEVATSKIEAKLDPMNSYERRIIHTTLAEDNRVRTESEGEEPNRYVVIKPKED